MCWIVLIFMRRIHMHWQVMPPFRVKNCVTFSLFGRVLAFGSWRLNLKNISAIFAIYNIQKSLCRLNFKKICPTFFLEYIGNFCELKSSVDISTSILCKWENSTKICALLAEGVEIRTDKNAPDEGLELKTLNRNGNRNTRRCLAHHGDRKSLLIQRSVKKIIKSIEWRER